MIRGLEKFEEMHKRLEELIAHPPAPGEANSAAYFQERGKLDKYLKPYFEYRKLREELDEARNLAGDQDQEPEFRELARQEAEKLQEKAKSLERDLASRLAAAEEGMDRTSAIIEIRAGTGGEEAALFAGDLYRMYRRYCERKGWKVRTLDASPTEMGGFREVIFRAEGEAAPARLRFEAGTHRVQRVPKTEAQGRIHTSAATVAVLAEPEPLEVELDEADLEISFMHSQGPGGQSVNTADSCVRILHKPSGIQVKCQVEKSQHRNRALALQILRARLLEQKRSAVMAERSRTRRSQIGTGDRSERIRTYNFPQNRVTDHRLTGEKNFPLERVIGGELDGLLDRLVEESTGAGLGTAARG